MKYLYTAKFSNGIEIIRKTSDTFFKAWGIFQDGNLVASGFCIRPKKIDFVFGHPFSIVEVVDVSKEDINNKVNEKSFYSFSTNRHGFCGYGTLRGAINSAKRKSIEINQQIKIYKSEYGHFINVYPSGEIEKV